MRLASRAVGDQAKLIAFLAVTLVLAIGFYLYYPALHIGFIHDDWGDSANTIGLDFKTWLKNSFAPLAGDWRSMTTLFWIILYRLFEYDFYYYHLTHILTHLLNTGFVYLLARKLGESRLTGVLIAAFFCWQQALVGPVAWNSASIDQKLVLFGVPAFLVYLRATRNIQAQRFVFKDIAWGWMPLFYFLFYCTLKSKLLAVTFPAVFVVYEGLYRTPNWTRSSLAAFAKRLAAIQVPVGIILAIYMIGWHGRYGDVPREGEYGVTLTLSHYLQACSKYIRMIVLNDAGGPLPTGFISLAVGAGALILSWRLKAPSIAFGILWFFFAIFPVAVLTTHHFPHHLYWPMVGISIVAGGTIGRGLEAAKRASQVVSSWRMDLIGAAIVLGLYFSAVKPPIRDFIQWASDAYAKAQVTLASVKEVVPVLPEAPVRFLIYPHPPIALFDYSHSLHMLYNRYTHLNVTAFDDEGAFLAKLQEAKKTVQTGSANPEVFYGLRYDPSTGLVKQEI